MACLVGPKPFPKELDLWELEPSLSDVSVAGEVLWPDGILPSLEELGEPSDTRSELIRENLEVFA